MGNEDDNDDDLCYSAERNKDFTSDIQSQDDNDDDLSYSAERNKDFTSDIRSDFSLDDLNFDPAALIGENSGDWSVSLQKKKLFYKGDSPPPPSRRFLLSHASVVALQNFQQN